MWRLKQFIPKEPAGLEGRTIDVGSVKIVVRNAIAEGGFSCVYLARDAASQSKQYALKHMICQDGESLDLAMQEISVMKLLRGHPNVVTLVAHSIFDMGRTREALLVMEFCDKSLVTVLESRGAGYFEEKQILLIFRDVCNAVFAMHCQSPPVAHRDLKAENILLGSDGAWKLCDFGSTSTNHKCFDRPEEMGVEEDNIRKHTTPAYRAPEMWDLYRREVISEKVDIWALGCLLYRICYFKSAFDGESKLQILNGNYRIPELPKYSASIMSLIKDMLESSPDARPDITQVWFRVNELLPAELQKHLPDGSLSGSAVDMHPPTLDVNHEEIPKRSPVMPRRSPPPPPPSRDQVRSNSPQSEKEVQHASPSLGTSKVSGGGSPMGAFWSTQHAQNSYVVEGKGPLFDKEQTVRRSVRENSFKAFEDSRNEDFEISFSPEQKLSHPESKPTFQNEAFNTFVVDFNSSTINKINKSAKEKELEEEVEKLREQLKQANSEKAEITSKYDKLSAICRSQRQEIQELKQALPASTPSPPSRDINSKTHNTPPREKIEGTVWELEQGMFTRSEESQDRKPWQAFAEPKAQTTSKSTNHPRSVRTTNGHRGTSKQQVATPNKDEWGFGQDSFSAASPGGGSSEVTRASAQGSTSLRFSGGETKKVETSQPAGWAGF